MKAKEHSSSTQQENPKRKPSEILREIFLARKEHNPHYSGRAFARDIGINQSFLAQLMSGRRSLTLTQALKITAALKNSESQVDETQELLSAAMAALPASAKLLKGSGQGQERPETYFIDIEVARFKVICQWYHLPILDLSTNSNFNPDPQ